MCTLAKAVKIYEDYQIHCGEIFIYYFFIPTNWHKTQSLRFEGHVKFATKEIILIKLHNPGCATLLSRILFAAEQ